MRISTNQLYDRSLRNILDNQGQLSDIQQQLATGKRILRPSDDPVGASQVVRITEELEQIEQFKKNNILLENSLSQEEAVLQNVTEAALKARQLTIQAGNGINGTEDRKALGVEIGQIRDQIFDLMNFRDANGEYIFAGYQSDSPAFIFDATATGNRYIFQGDDGQNEIQISPTVKVEGGDSGKTVFEDVLARLDANLTGGTTTSSFRITQQNAFDTFHKANYDAVTPANNVFRGTINAAGDQIDFINVGTGAAAGSVAYTPGQDFTFGGIEFNSPGTAGQTLEFTLQQPEKKNLAQTLDDLFTALNDPNISDADYVKAIDSALIGLDNGLTAVADANSAVGGRLNVAESVLKSNLDLEIANKAARSDIEEVDYAVAASELSRQDTALQAAQATFSRVTQLSLFDFI
ncbi:flagellar hook-associated protein FlgL [Alteromonas sp. a30]|uniref:flagellar hook-associated protein FlgL n=1 Tax=Alteromonas sp. a30 TaxID=2730917 RepID=UPI00228108E8|nr:flagellar hook-associated protein FlgL [Alteromonas sp. a30]MCY7294542.1 flagellar hook-associated protein FlgL [Alteromonas sp. a30]